MNVGMEEGSRNNGLYNLAVYYKKKYDDWQERTRDANFKNIKPPLPEKEASSVIASVRRKDFFYKCKEYPICQYCNKKECKKRKYGVGSSVEEFELDNLTKYISGEEVVWFAEYHGKRFQLNTEELLNQNKLLRRMVESLNKTFSPVKNQTWLNKIENLLSNSTVVYEPVQASRKGQFFELLDSFLTEGVVGREKEDLLRHNAYSDGNKIYFRSFNLFTFLKNKRFKYTEHEIWTWIKEKDAENKKIRIAKKPINVWMMPNPDHFQIEQDDEDKI